MGKFIDMTGWKMKEHGVPDSKITVVKRAEDYISPAGYRVTQWECQCDCGNIFVSSANNIKRCVAKSCGCLQKESDAENGRKSRDKVRTHGGHKDRLYKIWASMLDRCRNPKNKQYKDYGGRGITVCGEWRDYANFREWACNNGYDKNAEYSKCTLDRINNNGNYEPFNCRWVDMKTQAQNRRKRTA